MWAQRLSELIPAALPLKALQQGLQPTPYAAITANAGSFTASAGSPADLLLAAFGAYLLRMCNTTELDLAVYRPARAEGAAPIRLPLHLSAALLALPVGKAGRILRDELQRVEDDWAAAHPEAISAEPEPLRLTTAVYLGQPGESLACFENEELILAIPANGEAITWIYNPQVLPAANASQLLACLQTYLNNLTADPLRPLGFVSLLSPVEARLLLQEWNATRRDDVPLRCFHELFTEQVQHSPQATALVFAGQRVSYAELDAQTNRLARRLQGLGVGPEALVGICMERSIEMVVGLIAVLKAGGAFLPLDPSYPKERLAYMLADSGVRVLLTQSSLAGLLPEHSAQAVYLDSLADSLAGESASPPIPACGIDNLAYVIYTSGSTGQPKGVMVTHRGFGNLVAVQRQWYQIGPGDRVLQFASFSFDAAIWEMFGALLTGAALHLAPRTDLLPGPSLSKLIRQQGITIATLPPTALSVLTAESAPTLRVVTSAGEALTADLVKKWAPGRKMINGYGPTETTVAATMAECQPDGQTPTIGRPILNFQAYVLDANLEPAPAGVPGELCLGGCGLARGYLNRPDLTAARFIPNPFSSTPGERLYRTGDLVRYLPDGRLQFLGRIDHQVKVRGFRIEPGEIEQVLSQHPAIVQSVVLARQEQGRMDRLVAYVTLREDVTRPSDLRRYLAARLPDYMVPAAVVIMERMPLSPNGKIDRKALPEPDWELVTTPVEFIPPSSGLETTLVEIWKQALGVERIGAADNFFDLGGDSIKAGVVANQLQALLGEIVHVVAIFEAPTVSGLVRYLDKYYPAAVAKYTANGTHQSRGTPVDRVHARITAAKLAEFQELIASLPNELWKTRPEPKNPPAVFILAPPRSGTTLIRVLLGGHPGLFGPPELELLSFYTLQERWRFFAGLQSFWTEGAIRALMQLDGLDASAAQEKMQTLESQGMTTQGFYRQLQESLASRILVDKTATYALRRSILEQAELRFENPYYIHLIRHPYGMIHSFEEAHLELLRHPYFRHDPSLPPRQMAEMIWLLCHQNILEFTRQVPAERVLPVQFENLVANPGQVIQQVCQFLGLSFAPEMMNAYDDQAKRMTDGVRPESRMLGDVKFHQHRGINPQVADQWKQDYQEDFLSSIAWEIAGQFGYQPVQNSTMPAQAADHTAIKPVARRKIQRTAKD